MQVQNEKMSRAEFIRKVLERDVKNIYRSQQLLVSQNIYLIGKDLKAIRRRQKGIQSRTGRLLASLSNPDYYIQAEGENFKIASSYPMYIRMLDMKEHGNHRIFNRIVWGIIFNNAYRDIKKEYGKSIADEIGKKLDVAFNPFKYK